MSIKQRYIVLDGLRGILAITVVFHHLSFLIGSHFMRSAWLSVDLFFILSGFVISLSYADKIRAGMGFKQFVKNRMLRLYPLYFVAFILGILPLLSSGNILKFFDINMLWIWISGLFIFPYFGTFSIDISPYVSVDAVYPVTAPAWSLFFELISNFAFFILLMKMKNRSINKLMPIFFCAYFISLLYFGPHSGYSQLNFLGGFPRVFFHFFLGFLIFQYHKLIPILPAWSMYSIVSILLLAFNFGNLYILYMVIFIISPLSVIVGSRVIVDSASVYGRLFSWMGRISFPLYIVHYSVFIILQPIFGNSNLSSAAFVCVQTISALVVSHLLIYLEPWLQKIMNFVIFKKSIANR